MELVQVYELDVREEENGPGEGPGGWREDC